MILKVRARNLTPNHRTQAILTRRTAMGGILTLHTTVTDILIIIPGLIIILTSALTGTLTMGMGVILITGTPIIHTFVLGLTIITDTTAAIMAIMGMVIMDIIPEEYTPMVRDTGMGTGSGMEITWRRTSLGVQPADRPNSILVMVQEQRCLL
jgi:hypothetical protein